MYILFRVVITIFTCAISLLLFKKALNLRNNIKIILIVALNISVLISLYFLPFENLMIDFDTPQSAYSYMNGFNSNVVLEVDGKESVFVVENEEGIYKYSIISKSENGYKLSTSVNTKKILQDKKNDLTISVYRYKNTDDYYVVIFNTGGSKINVFDNKGSIFVMLEETNKVLDQTFTTYYAYVQNFDQSYDVFLEETGDGSVSPK